MKKDANEFEIMYTVQRNIVIDVLKKEGCYTVKKEYIKSKYGEVSSIMLNAYDWFVSKMKKEIPMPQNAEYPVWMSKDSSILTSSEDSDFLKLKVPKNEIILFDNHGWERVLSMNYVGKDADDEKKMDENFYKKGIQTGYDTFIKPYYPMERQQIINSWSRIFDVIDSQYVRGAAWKIESDWII